MKQVRHESQRRRQKGRQEKQVRHDKLEIRQKR